MYSGTPLIWTLIGQNEVSIQARGEKVVLHRKKKYIRKVSYLFQGCPSREGIHHYIPTGYV